MPSTRSFTARFVPATAAQAILLLALSAVLFYAISPTKDDVSWLIVNAQALWDGKRLYVDIIETNPPLSILLYLPAVAVENVIGLRAELGAIVMTALIAVAMARISARRLGAAGVVDNAVWFEIAVAFIFLWLPLGAFGQKDHVAAMIALPFLADLAVAAVAGRAEAPLRPRVWTGLLAGLTVAIKPQFALAIVLPALGLAVNRRDWRLLINAGSIAAGAAFLAFQGLVYLAFPAFFAKIVPMLFELYAPLRAGLGALIVTDNGLLVLIALLVAWLTGAAAKRQPLLLVLALAALGFFAAYVIQGKGWPYHLYPALAYALIAGLAVSLPAARVSDRRRFAVAAVALALVAGLGGRWMLVTWRDYSELTAAIRATGIVHPRILNIAASHGVGHPSTRDAGGVWVGTLMSRLITVLAIKRRSAIPADSPDIAAINAWEAYDRGVLTSDLATRGADIVLVQRGPGFDWLAWARQDAATARLLDGYAFRSRVTDLDDTGTIELFVRKTDAASPG